MVHSNPITFFTSNKIIAIVLLLFLYSVSIVGQSRKQQRKITKNQIQTLKKGVLMVRLDFKKEKIAFLRKHGRLKRAEKVERRWERRRKTIIAAFKENYTFSKYCFYFEGESKAIVKNRNYTNAITDLDATPCEYDPELPIYLLLLEQDRHDLHPNGPPHFYFYEVINGNASILNGDFPHDFMATKGIFLGLKQVDNIPACIARINGTLKGYL